MIFEKTCIACFATKPTTEFYRQGRNKDLLSGKCRECVADRIPTPRWMPELPAPPGLKRCVRCWDAKLPAEFRPKHRKCKDCDYDRLKVRKAADPVAFKAYTHTLYLRQRVDRRAKAKRESVALKLEVMTHYGGFCECCGEDDIRFLTLDHIRQNGAQHRKEIGSVAKSGFYFWVKRNGFPSFLRVLCFGCNVAAFRNGGICPHQETRLRLVA